jgi:hypothetical protein
MRKFMHLSVAVVFLMACQAALQGDDKKPGAANVTSADALAELYEHIADSIIKIRAAEDSLVKGLLIEYHAAAQRHLAEAVEKSAGRAAQLEAAATQIANIANEGDKRARAVRQRLSAAGHYHQKDTKTSEDYMFINSGEKASLLAVAKKVGGLGAAADPAAVKKASEELRDLFAKSIGRE